MRMVFLGTGEFAVPALRALVTAGHEVVRVISQPDRPAGRGLRIEPTAVHAAADELDVPHVQTADVNALDWTQAGGAELGVVAAFGQKLGPTVLGALPHGCINIHGSLLPRYRGAAPYQWAILNGEVTTGVTIFQIDQRWDAGPIWGRSETPIGETETADELHDRLAGLGAELLVKVLDEFAAGRLVPRPQDPAQASRAPKLSRADAALNWNQPAAQIVRRIHGLWSWPAATSLFVSRTGKRERLLLARARVVEPAGDPDSDFPAGAFRPDGTVQAAPGRVELLEVQPAGKSRMSFAAFANGRRLAPPDRLLPPETP